MSIVIRRFSPEDRSVVADLWRLALPQPPGRNDPDSDISRKMQVQPELFFVAATDGSIVGTAMAGYDGHRGWIYYVVVHPDRRRGGVGRGLVVHAEKALRDIGCVKINLQVRAGNEQVVGFYTALGYVTEARISMGKPLRTEADAPG